MVQHLFLNASDDDGGRSCCCGSCCPAGGTRTKTKSSVKLAILFRPSLERSLIPAHQFQRGLVCITSVIRRMWIVRCITRRRRLPCLRHRRRTRRRPPLYPIHLHPKSLLFLDRPSVCRSTTGRRIPSNCLRIPSWPVDIRPPLPSILVCSVRPFSALLLVARDLVSALGVVVVKTRNVSPTGGDSTSTTTQSVRPSAPKSSFIPNAHIIEHKAKRVH